LELPRAIPPRSTGQKGRSVAPGARVVVTGRIQSRTWETEDGSKRSVVEIEAEELAASLRFATVAITRATRAGAMDWVPDEEPAGETPAE
jgi:single-strand DNA-binding protein